MREKVDEGVIAQALALGAQDAVTLTNIPRLQLVVGRELRTYRLDRALSSTLASAREAKKQLQHIVEGSTDAIAQVQEGIIVDANPAWLALFGYSNPEEVVGTPLMDAFDPDDHAAIKGALVACMQGKWSGHTLHASALVVSGHTPSLEFQLVRAEFDGEPCVQVCVPARVADSGEYERKLEEAMQSDPATGFMHRRYFVDKLRARLAEPAKAGVRFLAYIEPDKYEAVHEELGVLVGEDFLTDFARLLREQVQPGDLAGRFGGQGFMLLIERGTTQDVEAWSEHVVHKIATEVLQAGAKSVSTTCTVGLGPVPAEVQDARGPGKRRVHGAPPGSRNRRQPRAAPRAHRRDAAAAGPGPPVGQADQGGADGEPFPAGAAADREPRRRGSRNVRRAGAHAGRTGAGSAAVGLHAGRRAQRPDEECRPLGDRRGDVVLRRAQARRVVRPPVAGIVADPSLPPGSRTSCVRPRSSRRASCSRCARKSPPSRSRKRSRCTRCCSERGFRFAIEGFGLGRDTEHLLGHLKPDFVKIHGALMQGLSADQDKQARVK